MMKTFYIIMLIALLAAAPGAWSHVDNPLLIEGCGSCHVGHGQAEQPMLLEAEEEFCYQCHGSDTKRSAEISEGRLSAAATGLADIEEEFKKPFRHPVVEGSGHSPAERLPALKGGSVDHAECVDCHNPHQRIDAGHNPKYDVAGYSLAGQYLESSLREYEVCLKCHSDYLGLDRGTKNLRAEFSLSVRSQHPVTQRASGNRLPSLAATLAPDAGMKCSDCHTSDDPNGPRGPHGSSHRYLLSGNYTLDVYTDESPYAFEFCYSCHDRSSILSNESFPLHREHIVGDLLSSQRGTSCYSCHASHGSRDNDHLIEFNPKAVTRDSRTGLLNYQALGEGSGQCYLQCHDHDHGPAKY